MGKGRKKNGGDQGGGKGIEDRFDTSTKPQFRRASPKSKQAAAAAAATKVVLDERFASVLTDPRFQLDVQDKYGRSKVGRKRGKTGRALKEELGEFYTIEDHATSHKETPSKGKKDDTDGHSHSSSSSTASKSSQTSSDSSSSSTSSSGSDKDKHHGRSKNRKHRDVKKAEQGNYDDDDGGMEDETPASRIAYLTALSRGQIDVSSSSSSSDDDDDDGSSNSGDSSSGSDDSSSSSDKDKDGGDDDDFGVAGVLDPSAKESEIATVEITEERSPYLAVTNLDWTHVRAVDVFGILASFCPPGSLRRVRVFLSDFGKERLEQEERYGLPSDIWDQNKDNDGKRSSEDRTKRSGENTTKADSDSDDTSPRSDEEDYRYENTKNGNGAGSEDDADDDDDDGDSMDDEGQYEEGLPVEDHVDSGFDMEKLRAYEASKLKYYFAVAEFASPELADIAYREVDGLEFEASSAAVDMRLIPTDQLEEVTKNREMRDEATSLPSNYVPPDFVVGALQQTKVQCTWEIGDRDRERTLTSYRSGEAWKSLADGNELAAYLASDVSSDDDSGASDGGKATNKRKMLSLDSDNSDNDMDDFLQEPGGKSAGAFPQDSSDDESEDSDEKNNGESEEDLAKEVTFIPGQRKSPIEEKIRSKLETGSSKPKELTPWEKYQAKRKQKRREKRQEVREKRKQINNIRKGKSKVPDSDDDDSHYGMEHKSKKQTQQELELLMAGGGQDDEAKDYDMRELQRVEKNKNKKLHGSRKQKEEERAAATVGMDFKIDTQDRRFSALLDGTDDRFGIDRTDPQYKETAGMREILAEQTRRRKKHRTKRDISTRETGDNGETRKDK